ncbi:MAG: nucleoside-diphosphate kinase [Chloroflexota bacterium]|nr:nucleoside-diphosphate kinase [Chloroflexota bacterium]MDE2685596.1 nucleoside-diphosphate kinase [Chloroflexota bacterium]
MERTFVAIKPDGVQRGLIGDVIYRLERRGLKLVAIRLMQLDEELAGRHYAEHVDRPFFASLVSFITSGPIVAMIWEGNNAVALARQTMGATNPGEAAPGTIRGDFGVDIGRNIVHGSDGPESAEREIGLFFGEDGGLDYVRSADQWIIES